MMPCPKCQTKVPARNTRRYARYVSRNYFCFCGQSFTTRERITRKWKRVNPMPAKKTMSGNAARISEMLKAAATDVAEMEAK